jgi:hypothetical protein
MGTWPASQFPVKGASHPYGTTPLLLTGKIIASIKRFIEKDIYLPEK